jgi:hypothetical protein
MTKGIHGRRHGNPSSVQDVVNDGFVRPPSRGRVAPQLGPFCSNGFQSVGTESQGMEVSIAWAPPSRDGPPVGPGDMKTFGNNFETVETAQVAILEMRAD